MVGVYKSLKDAVRSVCTASKQGLRRQCTWQRHPLTDKEEQESDNNQTLEEGVVDWKHRRGGKQVRGQFNESSKPTGSVGNIDAGGGEGQNSQTSDGVRSLVPGLASVVRAEDPGQREISWKEMTIEGT